VLAQRRTQFAAFYELMNNRVWDYLLVSLSGDAQSVHSSWPGSPRSTLSWKNADSLGDREVLFRCWGYLSMTPI